jgi:hypothetical protein
VDALARASDAASSKVAATIGNFLYFTSMLSPSPGTQEFRHLLMISQSRAGRQFR